MIRRATLEDLPVLVAMGARFRSETAYAGLVDQDGAQLEALTRFLLEHGAVFVAQIRLEVIGMLAATVVRHPVDGALTGSEIAWWIEPEFRGGSAAVRLLEAAEAWAKNMGARRFQMVAPTANARVGELYRRRGYAEVETTWQRELVGEGI